ncbi:MAG TPA: NUDIX domain-containing protein [Candidatus Saccharimonadales bacterium]|nr:NUDIX domain-containing protein [Candidatus Saccharimonadales bacterium]
MAFALIIPKIENTNKLVFQRRDGKAPTDPNLLGLFGGSLEAGETPIEAAFRELTEETSLQVAQDDLTLAGDADMPTAKGPAHAHVYTVVVPDADFEVYEGEGLEVFTKDEVLSRNDLAPAARHLLELVF